MKVDPDILRSTKIHKQSILFRSHRKYIFDRYDTDVYAHLWWDEDEDYDRSHVTDWEFSTWLQMEKCPKDREDLDEFVDKWQPVRMKTSKPKEFWNEKMWSELENRFDGKIPQEELSQSTFSTVFYSTGQ